jgi:hypothetical protein
VVKVEVDVEEEDHEDDDVEGLLHALDGGQLVVEGHLDGQEGEDDE